MPTLFQPSFSAGEISPGLRFRSDLAKWRAGAARLTNMFVHFSGGVSNRAGTQFVGFAVNNDTRVRLIPFVYSTEQAYVLELGNASIRIVAEGAYLTVDGAPLSIATPYAFAELADLKYTQANDVMTFCHPNHPAYELRRLGQVSWSFAPITFGTRLDAPSITGSSGEGDAPPGTPTPQKRDVRYAVSAVGTSPPDESAISNPVTINNYDLGYNNQTNVRNLFYWNAVDGAEYYNVYRHYQGVWAFVGSTTETQFVDTNTLPDTATTPPEGDNPFDGGNHPASVGYHQQRRVFGGARFFPLALYFTRAGNYASMDVSQPIRPDDAIVAALVARQNNDIRHLVPLQDLVVLTAGAAWSVTGNNGVITPADLVVRPQAYVGASNVTPVTVNYDLLYVREMGAGLTGLSFEQQAQGFTARDLSVLASHLFVGFTVTQIAYAAEPHKVLWCARSDGKLLGFTYLREQDVYAWHRHETDGFVGSVASIPEDGQDTLYLAVTRQIGGVPRTCVERMRPRKVNDEAPDAREAWFVDCGLQYRGSATTVIYGLGHLEGREVAILADGNVVSQQTVTSGGITLDRPASIVTVGLPYVSEVQTLPLDAAPPQTIQGKRKRVARMRVFVENTRGLTVGVVDQARVPGLVEFKERTTEAWGQPTRLLTGSEEVLLPPGWGTEAALLLRQTRPLPCTILGVLPDFDVGEIG